MHWRSDQFRHGVMTLVLGIATLLHPSSAKADAPVRVAVAANFKEVHAHLAALFTELSGHPIESVVGSTGKLYAQIANGAPFHVFLAADEAHPAMAERDGLAVVGSRFTYATGRLALVSARAGLPPTEASLRSGAFTRLAIANPELAPYGAASKHALTQMGLWDDIQPTLVMGESIGQTYQFYHTGNADLALVALSQVIRDPATQYWLVPTEYYVPIIQQAVLLTPSTTAARAYVDFLRSAHAQTIIESYGYGSGDYEPRAAPAPALPFDWRPIAVTLRLATVTTVLLLLVATPVAWWLASGRSWLRTIVEALVAMPLVLPPTVLGFYLLVLLGPQGPVGAPWEALGGPRLVFSFPGLVVGSMLFSLPFVVQPIQNAFIAVGRRPLEVAATLRAGPLDRFFTVAIPMARPGFLTAATLGFAHTVGEFGVVLMIGGSIPGRTAVVSIAIYEQVESLQYRTAHILSAGMLAFSFAVLVLVYGLHRRAPMRIS